MAFLCTECTQPVRVTDFGLIPNPLANANPWTLKLSVTEILVGASGLRIFSTRAPTCAYYLFAGVLSTDGWMGSYPLDWISVLTYAVSHGI